MDLSRRNFLFCSVAATAVWPSTLGEGWSSTPSVKRYVYTVKMVARYTFDIDTGEFTEAT